jgi:hypothetical protein
MFEVVFEVEVGKKVVKDGQPAPWHIIREHIGGWALWYCEVVATW